jgi:hypothetical protein
MNFYLLSGSDRILAWRKFRQSLQNLPETDQLSRIARFWGDAPLQTYVIDWDKSNEWPSAWQLVHDGDFDSNVVAILMEQTLILLGWNPERLNLMFIKDSVIEEQMMILVIDNTRVLNYSYYEVFELEQVKNNYSIYVRYKTHNGSYITV